MEKEKQIESWWDSLTDVQQVWLGNKFFKNDDEGINTLEKVIHCYNSLTRDELLELSTINR